MPRNNPAVWRTGTGQLNSLAGSGRARGSGGSVRPSTARDSVSRETRASTGPDYHPHCAPPPAFRGGDGSALALRSEGFRRDARCHPRASTGGGTEVTSAHPHTRRDWDFVAFCLRLARSFDERTTSVGAIGAKALHGDRA